MLSSQYTFRAAADEAVGLAGANGVKSEQGRYEAILTIGRC